MTLDEQIQEYVTSNRVIYLADTIIDNESCANLLVSLETMDSVSDEPITIKILSNFGGEWCAGMAVYSCIRRMRSPVNVEILGSAASMATVFCQCANKITMCNEAVFMVHSGECEMPSTVPNFNLKSLTQYNELVYNEMLEIYAQRCQRAEFFRGKTIDEIKKFIDNQFHDRGDWYLTAKEALTYGFIDEVI